MLPNVLSTHQQESMTIVQDVRSRVCIDLKAACMFIQNEDSAIEAAADGRSTISSSAIRKMELLLHLGMAL